MGGTPARLLLWRPEGGGERERRPRAPARPPIPGGALSGLRPPAPPRPARLSSWYCCCCRCCCAPAGAMLGKDYMLAIILVDCDGERGGELPPLRRPPAWAAAFGDRASGSRAGQEGLGVPGQFERPTGHRSSPEEKEWG